MPADRKPSLILPVAVTLAVLLGLYFGAYCWTAQRLWGDPVHGFLASPHPRYDRWRAFFRPAHWLDRRIRPHVWERDR